MERKKYYVVSMRLFKKEAYVNLFDFNEAVKRRWIDENGNRIWVVSPEEEKSITSVFGFDDLDKAIEFYECLMSEVGMKVYAK